MKRTVAAFTILVGLTAVMVGVYIQEFKTITEILQGYLAMLP